MPLSARSEPADAIAAIVLAAGYSSRMGAFKPLLPFGGRTVLSHVVTGLRKGGVLRIHVVTGHQAALLEPEIAALGATQVHNPAFADGMFTSVKAGVASLPPATEGFLLLPVDIPLVRPSTIARVLRAAAASDAPILHPVFRAERGHPPYVGRALFGEILASDGEGGLRAILARRVQEAREVAVFDRGCVLDMDSPGDYDKLTAALTRCGAPGSDECEAMLEAADTPAPTRSHCRAVAALAVYLARRLHEAGEPINADIVEAAALLHDIAKGQPDHAEAGAALVREFGFPAVADVAARHMTLSFGGHVDESAVVYLADKLVRGETRVSLESRFAPKFQRYADTPGALAGARQRYADAQAVLAAIEARIGPLDVQAGTAPPAGTGACS
jgi:molybdenum cofactor cytidylyltransferase